MTWRGIASRAVALSVTALGVVAMASLFRSEYFDLLGVLFSVLFMAACIGIALAIIWAAENWDK